MCSGRKCLLVQEIIAKLYSDPLSDISNSESSDTGTVDSNLPTKMRGKVHSLVSVTVNLQKQTVVTVKQVNNVTQKLLTDGVNVTTLLKLKDV
jgi:hypothetical protein